MKKYVFANGRILASAGLFIFCILSFASYAQQWNFVKDIGFMSDYRLQKIKSGKNNDCIGLFRKTDTAGITFGNCPYSAGTETVSLVSRPAKSHFEPSIFC